MVLIIGFFNKLRFYAMDDTMIYDGMIFKANHNLFEVNNLNLIN